MGVVMSMDVFLIAQINLLVQIVILVFLFAGLFLKRRNRFFSHGTAMLVALVLNAISFFVVMGVSLVNRAEFIASYLWSRLSLVIVVHSVLGSIAEILGVWIVVRWRLRSDAKYCIGRKKVMRTTAVLWTTALLLGILLYTYLYL
jgi:uncharacterized membrane protein YozB (DUF420 family)